MDEQIGCVRAIFRNGIQIANVETDSRSLTSNEGKILGDFVVPEVPLFDFSIRPIPATIWDHLRCAIDPPQGMHAPRRTIVNLSLLSGRLCWEKASGKLKAFNNAIEAGQASPLSESEIPGCLNSLKEFASAQYPDAFALAEIWNLISLSPNLRTVEFCEAYLANQNARMRIRALLYLRTHESSLYFGTIESLENDRDAAILAH